MADDTEDEQTDTDASARPLTIQWLKSNSFWLANVVSVVVVAILVVTYFYHVISVLQNITQEFSDNNIAIPDNHIVIRDSHVIDPSPSVGARAEELNNALLARELVQKLSTATAKYNRLTDLWYQKPETVVYRIDLNSPNGPSLAAALEGDTVSVELPVTPSMSVELTGSAGLEIEPIGKTKQRVSNVSSTSWMWRVTAIDVDEQFLTLTTYVHLSGDEGSEPYTVRTYEDDVKVNVKLLDYLMATVSKIQPIWAFACVVVVGLVGAYGWFRRKGWRASRKPFVSKIQGIRRGNKNS